MPQPSQVSPSILGAERKLKKATFPKWKITLFTAFAAFNGLEQQRSLLPGLKISDVSSKISSLSQQSLYRLFIPIYKKKT